ncbi:MAG: hypothetical protein H6669_20885 [Ardenticatenaceae bacterium]|nr:hypothetical protein [Ardenticatenaceae bacterium]
MTFRSWLLQQQSRADRVGKLARALSTVDYSHTPARRKDDEHKKWADIITRQGKPEHIQAFNRAWNEYLAAKGYDS